MINKIFKNQYFLISLQFITLFVFAFMYQFINADNIFSIKDNEVVEIYNDDIFYGRFTKSEYEKLQQDTYQKYLGFGEYTNSEIIYDDFMPTISVYYNCTMEQWSYWAVNNSQLAFDNFHHRWEGGCFIHIYLIDGGQG